MRHTTIILLVVTALCYGQSTWERTYGGSDLDRGRSVAQTTDGGYIVVGYTFSFGASYSDVYLVKTDSLGDTIWTHTCGGSSNEYGFSVTQTSDSGYIVAGYTESFGAGSRDVYLIKTDSLGFSGTEWYEVNRGWNLLSFPFNDMNAITDAFPYATPPAYSYYPSIADYVSVDSASAGIGFWVKIASDTITAAFGELEATTIEDTLYRGWNLIGTVCHPISYSHISTDPPGLGMSDPYGWNGMDYFLSDSLYPGNGYWFLSSGHGRITVGP